jgi:hypothetical protein
MCGEDSRERCRCFRASHIASARWYADEVGGALRVQCHSLACNRTVWGACGVGAVRNGAEAASAAWACTEIGRGVHWAGLRVRAGRLRRRTPVCLQMFRRTFRTGAEKKSVLPPAAGEMQTDRPRNPEGLLVGTAVALREGRAGRRRRDDRRTSRPSTLEMKSWQRRLSVGRSFVVRLGR